MASRVSADARSRVNRGDFLARVSRRSCVPKAQVHEVFKAFVDEVLISMGKGEEVILTGFGKFYPQLHSGHSVQFSKKVKRIEDYHVLKFSSTKETNRKIGTVVDNESS